MSRRAYMTALKELLESRLFFSDAEADTPRPIPVLVQYEKQHQATLDQAVKKEQGLCVLIHVLDAQAKHPNEDGPILNPALTTLSVFANPDVNDTAAGFGIQAFEVADAIARIVQNNDVPGFGRSWFVQSFEAPDDDYERHDVIVGSVIPLSTDEPTRPTP